MGVRDRARTDWQAWDGTYDGTRWRNNQVGRHPIDSDVLARGYHLTTKPCLSSSSIPGCTKFEDSLLTGCVGGYAKVV